MLILYFYLLITNSNNKAMCGITVYTGKSQQIKELFVKEYYKIKHRGPDNSIMLDLNEEGWVGFHRLMIVDLTSNGNQPLSHDHVYLVCNGEIYNDKQIRKQYNTFPFKSSSDCESIIPLYLDLGIAETAKQLDAEFAFVLYDQKLKKYVAARDPIGIRPLFYGYAEDGTICFSSEMKSLHSICKTIKAFPPGHYYVDGQFIEYRDVTNVKPATDDTDEEILEKISSLFIEGVKKRLQADAPLGFLLSGGLDSSLVCAIGAKLLDKPIKTFAVGLNEGAIDLKWAKIVADHLGADHTEIIFTKEDVLSTLHELIYMLETYDITTIRASMGMYIMCKEIFKTTPVRTLLTGEISDELFGYKYTDFAPTPEEFQKEATKRIKEIYMYDVLRADRSMSGASLESRVPFGDLAFAEYVMSIPAEKKMNTTGIGKYLLRKSFEKHNLLPESILWREKAAFSDAVGHGMVDYLKEYADQTYTDTDVILAEKKYNFAIPFTKESLLYRDIFESHFPGRAELVVDFWMPNKNWENCNVSDPSARALPNYGKSGE